MLESAQESQVSSEEYELNLAHLRNVARDKGVEMIFQTYAANVIIGPTDSLLPAFATCGGKQCWIEAILAGLLKITRLPNRNIASIVFDLQRQAIRAFSHSFYSSRSSTAQVTKRMGNDCWLQARTTSISGLMVFETFYTLGNSIWFPDSVAFELKCVFYHRHTCCIPS